MRKSIIAKLSVGAALAAAIGFVPTAQAQLQGDDVTMLDPAVTLIMPFDVSENHASFQLVSRISGTTSGPVATHWSYWSESCDHLADVFICLTPKDTVVVDPTALQGQVQVGGENINTGPVVNLSGTKGFVTVTAFSFLEGSQACVVDDPSTASDEPSLVGSWVIANTVSNAAYGNNAIGLPTADNLPDASSVFAALDSPSDSQGLFVQTFDPTSLNDSAVYFIGVSVANGNGAFAASEIGPIPAGLSGGHAAECDAEYCDNKENCTSINNLLLDCSTSLKIADNDALGNDPNSIIPKFVAADTAGFIRLTNCVIGTADGVGSIGDGDSNDQEAFIFAFHGMAVGPFGTAVSGKYTIVQ
jgi:hypothetical protein